MAIHTLICPECGNTQEIDLPAGQAATMQHQFQSTVTSKPTPEITIMSGRIQHMIQVRPRVMPIEFPERSGGLKALPTGDTQPSEDALPPRPGPFNQPTDMNPGD